MTTDNLSPLFQRTHIILGDAGVERMRNARILLAGLGGVGSFAAEALARMGVGRLVLADFDEVSPSNLNRQLPALHSTIGRKKIDVIAERIGDINPDCQLTLLDQFLAVDDMEELLDQPFDWVVDAIDSLNSKVGLIATAREKGLNVAASMGAGGRTDPSKLHIGDLMDSEACPLARQVRRRVRRRGIERGVLAVWSTEEARPPLPPEPVAQGRPRAVNGTVSYMPALFGMSLAGAVIHRMLGE